MAVGIDEVPERPARQEIVDMGLPERPVGGVRGDVEAALADLAIGLDAGDLGKTTREIGEAQIRVHLPEPVGRDLGEIFEQTFERHPEPLPDRPSRRDVPKKPVIWSWKAPVFSLRAPGAAPPAYPAATFAGRSASLASAPFCAAARAASRAAFKPSRSEVT